MFFSLIHRKPVPDVPQLMVILHGLISSVTGM
jgi:hypothetical protein